MKKTAEQRFKEKYIVNEQTGCWDWIAYKHNGYGRFGIGGKIQRAHRVAWFLEHGYYPEFVLHKCHLYREDGKDNPACVNPEHLAEGTLTENQQDSKITGTFNPGLKKGHKYSKGENNGEAKLTQEQVDEMRAESTGAWGEKTRLAKKYGISLPQVSNILNNKVWLKQ